MKKYIVQMIGSDSGEVLETLEEEFDTYEEADEYSLVCSSNNKVGAEILEMGGRDFDDPDDVDFIVEEIEK